MGEDAFDQRLREIRERASLEWGTLSNEARLVVDELIPDELFDHLIQITDKDVPWLLEELEKAREEIAFLREALLEEVGSNWSRLTPAEKEESIRKAHEVKG